MKTWNPLKMALGCFLAVAILTPNAATAATAQEAIDEQRAETALEALDRVLPIDQPVHGASSEPGGTRFLAELTDTGALSKASGHSIELRFVDGAARGKLAGNQKRAVYGASGNAVNFAASADGGRFAAYAIIHGSGSQDSFEYEFFVDGAPATLAKGSTGQVLLKDASGRLMNTIAPAWAVDATGKQLPTFYSIRGNVLTQTVELRAASYSVVADPALSCDWALCTQQLNKNETSTVANVGGGNAGAFGAMCALAMPWLGVACLTYGLAIWNTAVHARDTGRCLSIQYRGTGMQVVWPVIYNGPNCR
ncbi:hypothetical protein [Arthrobacter sp. B2a2-09]|uniref:hypothetical protein n=1 Tax=Arthrobacter sp. B2a2-09 TaxID=2952822 RepID=UPI0022CD1FED|nr:hypothetical protein [Arthrobacter sp. B2a2-09]MCZ9884270.1 hypothetical protein [Arthrobacter sp. B2a2-09]